MCADALAPTRALVEDQAIYYLLGAVTLQVKLQSMLHIRLRRIAEERGLVSGRSQLHPPSHGVATARSKLLGKSCVTIISA